MGVTVGRLPSGPLNAITDVAGVQVGHCTVTDEHDHAVQTGATVVLPHPGNLFRQKVIASCHVINGFGKSTGLIQVKELGQIESPIGLTNTLSVPAVWDGVLDALLSSNPEVGTSTGSVNVVVTECNDATLNDLRGRHVRPEHVATALHSARGGPVLQGAVGAGRGMAAFGLKGGIGTASREIVHGDRRETLGVLVLSNFGSLSDLVVVGRPVGRKLARERAPEPSPGDGGSIIVVVATTAPLTDRQLGRVLRRVQNGIARTGSTTASGSGEIVVGFTTAFKVPHFTEATTMRFESLVESEELFNTLFTAMTEATEEAILNSLFNAETVEGRNGARRERFPLERLPALLSGAG